VMAAVMEVREADDGLMLFIFFGFWVIAIGCSLRLRSGQGLLAVGGLRGMICDL
jgi:hypothetical protein